MQAEFKCTIVEQGQKGDMFLCDGVYFAIVVNQFNLCLKFYRDKFMVTGILEEVDHKHYKEQYQACVGIYDKRRQQGL